MDPIPDGRSGRIIHKPTRYECTSSDEEPRRRKHQRRNFGDSGGSATQPTQQLLQVLEQQEHARKLDEIIVRLIRIEAKLDKLAGLCDESLPMENYGKKPQCLSLQTKEDVDKFENCSAEEYDSVVNYFCFVGGPNLERAITACFREAIADSLLSSYTWFGTNSSQPLYTTKIVQAIFDAACESKIFAKPTRRQFQNSMRVVLKACKERVRYKRKSNTAVRLPNPWV